MNESRIRHAIESSVPNVTVPEVTIDTVHVITSDKNNRRTMSAIYAALHSLDENDIAYAFRLVCHKNEPSWAASRIKDILENATRHEWPRNFHHEIDVSIYGSTLSIHASSCGDAPGCSERIRKAIDDALPACRRIFPAGILRMSYNFG